MRHFVGPETLGTRSGVRRWRLKSQSLLTRSIGVDRPERPKKGDIKLLVTAVSYGIAFPGETIEALKVAIREAKKRAGKERPNEIQKELAEDELGELKEDLEDDEVTRKSLAEELFESFWEAAIDNWEDDPEVKGQVDIEPKILERCFGIDPSKTSPRGTQGYAQEAGNKGCVGVFGWLLIVGGGCGAMRCFSKGILRSDSCRVVGSAPGITTDAAWYRLTADQGNAEARREQGGAATPRLECRRSESR